MRTAAALLASPPGLASLHALAAAAGCSSAPNLLAADAQDALGLPHGLETVAVCAGPGALRALVVRGCDATPPREHVARIASRLASRTPQLLWLVVAEDASAEERVIASWSAERVPPRVVALSAERARIVDSDAETVCALAAAAGSSDLLTHARWLEILGRDSLTRRFYRTLERTVALLAGSLSGRAAGGGRSAVGGSAAAGISDDERRTLALYTLSRLLFLSFLEAKGWLDGDRDFLSRRFTEQVVRGGGFHGRVLEPLFFGTLNTQPRHRSPAARALGAIPYLNGGLFTRAPLERTWRRARFGDEALGTVFDDLLARHRLTAREDRSTWSDAAVDPEMLGRAFESLMAAPERRSSGVFFTPHALVERVLEDALGAHLAEVLTDADAQSFLAGAAIESARHASVRTRLEKLRLLDPACGSGAFLVYALERVADLLHRCGDDRDVGTVRREVLARSIFGVDVSPTAVWLCELRLWLSVVIESNAEQPRDVPPLPNLDHNVRIGDSLAGAVFDGQDGLDAARAVAFARLRTRYTRATGQRKRTLARELERAERDAAKRTNAFELVRVTNARRELILATRQRDLFGERSELAVSARTLAGLRAKARELRAALRALREGRSTPFSFGAHFADVAGGAGFDLVVGNPPWVRLHNIPARARERLRREFDVYRLAAWESGAAGAGAGRGFAAQVDLSALFIERSVRLLKPEGTLALLVPAKLWRSLAGGGVRRFLAAYAPPLAIDDWSESVPAFDAAVYPSLLVARRTLQPLPEILCAVHRRETVLRWHVPRVSLALDSSPGSPWLIAPHAARAVFDQLLRRGTPLAASAFGRPLLGVKCGLNEAFLVGRDADVEASLLRPIVRGETLTPWRITTGDRILSGRTATTTGRSPDSPISHGVGWSAIKGHCLRAPMCAAEPHGGRSFGSRVHRARYHASSGPTSAGLPARRSSRPAILSSRSTAVTSRAAQRPLTRSRSPRCSTHRSPRRGSLCSRV